MADRVDYTLEDFVLDVTDRKSLDVDVSASVTSGDLELTIEGASNVTLTLEDADGRLLGSDVLSRWAWGDDYMDEDAWVRKGRAIDARLDGHPYRLVKVAKAGSQVTLTFEDRIATYLRHHKGARKATRGKVTRAEFVKMLVDEVKAGGGIDLYCPELHKTQPIAKAAQATRKPSSSGIPSDAKLKVQGKQASREQLRNMERVLDCAASHRAGAKATLALVEACIVESLFRNLSGGDADSAGILQVRVGLHGAAVARDVEASVAAFLTKGFAGAGGAIALAKAHPTWSAGQVAQAVQASNFPDRYDHWRDEAVAIIAAYGGGGGTASSYYKRYDYARGANETSWDAIGRLADEVGWRRFIRSGELWFISEEELFGQKHRLRIHRDDDGRWADGVDDVDFELDMEARVPVAEVTVTCRADRWVALPGMVVLVEDAGPASGRWLVSSVTGSLFDGARTITLRKPIPEKPEPRSEAVERDAGGGGSSGVDAFRSAAQHISDQNRSYVYGGGHGVPLSKIGVHDGLDCSSSVSLALKRAGMFDGSTAIVSGDFASSWGKPGKGKRLTVWANGGHVWVEAYDASGKFAYRFDTSPYGDGPDGPHVRRKARPTAGFTPRHWPGT